MDEPEIDPNLEARWSRLDVQDPPIDATIRPRDHELGTAPTLGAPGALGGLAPPPRLGLRLADEHRDETAELQIVGALGEGGMASVLLARQRSLQREVALKAARPEDARSAEAILAEGVVTGALEHPAIVPVHLLGVDDDGRPAIVMKRIDGVTWSALIADSSHPGWEGWGGDPSDRLPGHVQIMTAICNALAFAHSRGWVHRDIKPANVLIGRFGDVYVADWGIAARLGERSDSICGTPGYLAPEMAVGQPVDARTDVYLLSACLHHVLVGAPRHVAPTALGAAALSMVSMPFIYPDRVPFELAALANRGCHLDPAERPASAIELREALAAWMTHRESVSLADDARARLAELEDMPTDATDVETRTEVDRRETQAGFAVERALQIWPENPVARELRDRLEARLSARRAREAALAADARDRDPTIGGGGRAVVLALGTTLLLGISALSMWIGWPGAPRVGLVFYPALFWVGCLGLVLLARRLLRTRYNRHAAMTVLVLFGFIPLERLAAAIGEVPFTHVYALDALVFSAGLTIYGITQQRWTLWVAGVAFVSGMTTLIWPEHVFWTYGMLTVLATALTGLLGWRHGRRKKH